MGPFSRPDLLGAPAHLCSTSRVYGWDDRRCTSAGKFMNYTDCLPLKIIGGYVSGVPDSLPRLRRRRLSSFSLSPIRHAIIARKILTWPVQHRVPTVWKIILISLILNTVVVVLFGPMRKNCYCSIIFIVSNLKKLCGNSTRFSQIGWQIKLSCPHYCIHDCFRS